MIVGKTYVADYRKVWRSKNPSLVGKFVAPQHASVFILSLVWALGSLSDP